MTRRRNLIARKSDTVSSVKSQTNRPSFLARTTLGHANYLLLAMAAVFLIALIPIGARRAYESQTNKAEDWLPSTYSEATDLQWFREHFVGEQFVLLSWDGCTLGNTLKLDELSRKLIPSKNAISSSPNFAELSQRTQLFKRVITGPNVISEMMAPPLSLDYAQAAQRLQGALVGPVQRDARGKSLGDATRTTCLAVYLSPAATKDNRTMRAAIDKITTIAVSECAIPLQSIHMGGPPVDNIAIDIEGERTLMRLALLAGAFGFLLSYCCFQSVKATVLVFSVGVLSAGMSLAIVFYFGIIEVAMWSAERPELGTVDAILMTMPAVVYVLGLSGAVHLLNYYRQSVRSEGVAGAAEKAVKLAWKPCALAAFITAAGLIPLITSDILPIKKFGLFTSIAVVATVVILFLIVPAFLHRFPLGMSSYQRGERKPAFLPDWTSDLFGFVLGRNALACILCLIITGVFAYGFTKVSTSVQLLKLFDSDNDLIQDYSWLEANLGNVVPMELVVTMPPERFRTAEEHAEQDGRQYRMTMLERLDMIREIQFQVESLPEVSRALSAATFAPEGTYTGISRAADRSGDYAINKSLEENSSSLLGGDYLRLEQLPGSTLKSGRELWRLSARVAAVGNLKGEGSDIDYGQFVEELKSVVDPVLVAHQQRDMIVEQLHKQGKRLDGAQLCILYRTPNGAPEPDIKSQESVLANLLLKSGVQPKTMPDGKKFRGVSFYNLSDFDTHVEEPQYLDSAIHALSAQDALILVSAGSDPTAKKFVDGGLTLIDVTDVPVDKTSAAIEFNALSTPRSVRSVYTGAVPLVYKTQRQLLLTLQDTMLWAVVLIAGTMIVMLRSAVAGLVSLLPNLFPIVVIFGALGWLDIKVNIGIMMCASVALGIAVTNTIHFLTWFRRGVNEGLDRVQAVILAYNRCSVAMVQTTIIGGLGLAVFGLSTFTPTQQFGYLMLAVLGTALVGDLLLLPALLAGPLGYYFGGKAPRSKVADLAKPGAFARASERVFDRLAYAIEDNEHDLILEPASPQEFVSTVRIDLPATEVPSRKLPVEPVKVEAPKVPTRAATFTDADRKEVIDGPHADLHARLRNLRRESPPGTIPS
jgi:predicted RND superfamily exporter protein